MFIYLGKCNTHAHVAIIINEMGYPLEHWKRNIVGAGLRKGKEESDVIPFQ